MAVAAKAANAIAATCGQAFCERTGTLFHKRQTPEGKIIECLALLAERMRISSLSRVKRIKADTILDWIRSAGAGSPLGAEAVEALLVAEYELSHGQLDGLCSYVGNKGEKSVSRKQRDDNGNLIGIDLRVIFGDEDEVLALLGGSTAYIAPRGPPTHLTMRHFNGRLVRKSLAFSKDLAMQ